jgi:Flagellar hook-length control protein FliK
MSAESPLNLLLPATTGLNNLSPLKLQSAVGESESESLNFSEQLENAIVTIGQDIQPQATSQPTPEVAIVTGQINFLTDLELSLDQGLDQLTIDAIDLESESKITIEPEVKVVTDLILDPALISNPADQTPLHFFAKQLSLPVKTLNHADAVENPIVGLNAKSTNPTLMDFSANELLQHLDESAIAGSAVDEGAVDDSAQSQENLVLAKNKTQPDGLIKSTKDFIVSAELNMQDNQSLQKMNAINSLTTEANNRLVDFSVNVPRNLVVQTQVPVAVAHPQWAQAVGEKVLWLAAQNVSSAEIKLDPPELGSLQVKVSLHQDQASVTFVSPHAPVRDALDQQMQRLRDMFQEQGIALLHVDVSDKSFSRQRQDTEDNSKNTSSTHEEEGSLLGVTELTSRSIHLIDHYA